MTRTVADHFVERTYQREALPAAGRARGNATVVDPLTFINNAADPNVSNVFASFANPNDGSSPAVEGFMMARREPFARRWCV